MRPVRGLAAGLALALIVSAIPVMARGDDEEEARRTIELELLAATIWHAVMARDVETLLRYVNPEGVGEGAGG